MFINQRPNWNKIVTTTFAKCSQGNVYHKLNLNKIGLDISYFNRLRLSYNNLPIDKDYPIKQMVPTRFRRYVNFDVDVRNKDLFRFNKKSNDSFHQDVEDFRKTPRLFSPMENEVIDPYFYHLMTQIVGLTLHSNPNILKVNVSIHQVRLLSYPNLESDNAPEGIHRDGADYIVSALIMNKYNIKEGVSSIYDPNKKFIYSTNLEEGEFIFQEDRHLWHDITPIKSDNNYIGYRDILGFDLKIIE